jgi:hydroxypyruvate reductase
VRAGIRAVDPARLVAQALHTVTSARGGVVVIAAGKASVAMAGAALAWLGERATGGLVVSPEPAAGRLPLVALVGEHPQPGRGSEDAGRRALDVAAAVPPDGELLVLISGGASSLLAVPAEGVSLEDKRETTGILLRAGADIHALNTVRKHLSRIKGGRLAAACPAPSRTFVLSDVVGDDLSIVASGPTVADASTYADALAVIDRFGGRPRYPAAVVAHLEEGMRGLHAESPKPGDPRLARAQTTLVGGRMDAMHGAAAEARQRGYGVVVLDEAVVGEARAAGPEFVQRALGSRTPARSTCIIASGETTVRVVGRGKGGRNQELALSAAPLLAAAGYPAVFASVGTDGIDGPTDAAGAIVDNSTIARAERAGLPPAARFLEDNNSHAFFDLLGDLIRTGPSGTNVGDLQVCLVA